MKVLCSRIPVSVFGKILQVADRFCGNGKQAG